MDNGLRIVWEMLSSIDVANAEASVHAHAYLDAIMNPVNDGH